MNSLILKKSRLWLKQVISWYQPQQEKILAFSQPYREKLKTWWRPQQEKLAHWASPHYEKLKTRWQSLAPREKNALQGGALLVLVLLLYAFLWSPLNTHLDKLRTQIQGEKKTAAWIQTADKQIRALENEQKKISTQTLSLRLNTIQEELRQGPLSKMLTQLNQSGADEIHCVFERVDFDTLMGWLIPFAQEHDLSVKQASFRRLNNVGLVQAEFVFRAS
jgi:type II secretory pathway component PulM